VTLPPHCPPPEDLPLLGDIFSRQAGISIKVGWPKRPQTGTGSPAGPLLQPRLALVSPNLQGECWTDGDGDVLLTWGFVGLTILTGCWGYYGPHGGAVLVKCRGCEAPDQENPPLVLLASVL
jgi:hypothetical protein